MGRIRAVKILDVREHSPRRQRRSGGCCHAWALEPIASKHKHLVGERAAISAFTIARPAAPSMSLVTTDGRMSPSERILSTRSFSLESDAGRLPALPRDAAQCPAITR